MRQPIAHSGASECEAIRLAFRLSRAPAVLLAALSIDRGAVAVAFKLDSIMEAW